MLFSIPREATIADANNGRNGYVAAMHGDDTTIMATDTARAIGAAIGMVERDRGTESMLAVLGISHTVTVNESEGGNHETHTWIVPAGIPSETIKNLSVEPNGISCRHGYDCGKWYAEPVRIERGTYPIDAHDTVTQEWYINA